MQELDQTQELIQMLKERLRKMKRLLPFKQRLKILRQQ